MSFVKIIYDNNFYDYDNANSNTMAILGLFLSSDVGCGLSTWPSFKDWVLNDSLGECLSGNITRLEKEGNYILLTDLYSEEEPPTELKITRKEFIQILTDWEEKVCKLMPKEVIITYDNDEFVIKTKD